MKFNVKVRVSMATRFGGFLIPSLLMHGAIFAALASASVRAADEAPDIDVIEFVTITEHGGGRLGSDSRIGDAAEPAKPPEKLFRKVKPKRQPKAPPKPTPEPAKPAAPAEDWSGVAAADSAPRGESGGAVSHSLVSGSAGSDPNATAAGVGSGSEGGVDRRTALRAWLREIQREANKIASRNYPSAAVRQGLEGKLRLGITIGEDGSILGVRLLTSCGHTVLDEAATESVLRLRIPPPPKELGWHEREIALPVRFALH